MIVLDKITKKIGVRILFEDVCAAFNTGHRYGLTGPNGAGKSTLLKIMMGIESSSSGSVSLPKKVGFLKQNISEFEKMRARDVVIMGNAKLWKTLVERDQLYEQEMTDEIGMRLGELEEIVADEDGYTAESDAEILLSGMGIDEADYETPMHLLPLDMQFRALLCQAIFGKPEALLLDEPTNHLDLGSIRWLENFLQAYEGTLIVVSHDRHFLNAVCTDIADIDYDTIITYPGNYDDMICNKSQIRSRTESDNKSKEKKVAQLKEFVSKFGSGTRSSQAQSRIKEINRLQPQDLKKSNIVRPFIKFEAPEKHSGQIPFHLKNVCKSFDHDVIRHLSTEIHRGDKVGIIGSNGRGKSTLLRMLVGELEPTSGEIKIGHETRIGYFPQVHSDVVDKSKDISVLDWLRDKKAGVHEQDIRGALGKLLFSGDDAFKSITKLSGGETARLIIASIMLNRFNTLVLDEPNNHLDLESVSALSSGLEDFPGTVVIASHDRDLIATVATKIIALESDGIHIFQGNLEEYLNSRAEVY